MNCGSDVRTLICLAKEAAQRKCANALNTQMVHFLPHGITAQELISKLPEELI